MTKEQLIAQAKERYTAYHNKRSPEQREELALKMLRLHGEEGLTYAQIGKRFGVSRQRVQQLIKLLITK